MRSALHFISTVLIAAGVMLAADAVVSVVWQEPVSAVMASRSQSKLESQLEELKVAAPTPAEVRELKALPDDSKRVAYAARKLRERTADGAALGKIVFPTLDKHYAMVNGDSSADLRKGPGIYPDTPMPGEGGTTGIAGHRTTYGAPFRDIDKLKPGNRIVLEMPYGTFTYAVQNTKIVKPTDLSVIKDVGYDRIVLTACHPLYSAAERIVVSARLQKMVPTRRIADVGDGARGR